MSLNRSSLTPSSAFSTATTQMESSRKLSNTSRSSSFEGGVREEIREAVPKTPKKKSSKAPLEVVILEEKDEEKELAVDLLEKPPLAERVLASHTRRGAAWDSQQICKYEISVA